MEEIHFQTAGYEVEPPEVMARNIAVGTRLFAAANVSLYGVFLFAYTYLRERDPAAVWRPSTVKVPLGTGIAVLACVLAAAAASFVAGRVQQRSGEPAWRPVAILSQLLMLGALGVQCYQYAALPFSAGSSPYASTFIAWTGFFAGFGLLGVIGWAQTIISGSIRYRKTPPGPVVSVAGVPGGEGALSARLGGEIRSFSFYLYFLAVVEIVIFVLLYAAV
jgi:heme/copper-type cytochrome/quinol oxidase subunit 3